MPNSPSWSSLLTDWSFEPQLMVSILLTGAIYAAGLRDLARRGRLWRTVRPWHAAAFLFGLLALVLALLSPIDTLDTRLFSVHMIQHLFLLQLAPALLLLGKPVPVLVVGLPRSLVRATVRLHHRSPALRGLLRVLTTPLVAWPLYVGDIVLWHVPAFYNATLTNTGVHLLEHICFLATGVLFWWVAIEPWRGAARVHPGIRLLYAAAAMLPMNLLGALYTFADTLWYPFYATQPALWGRSPLDDQRLGGIIMWVPGSMAYMCAASILFFIMLAQDERDADDGEDASPEWTGSEPVPGAGHPL